jgi:hypothetical protein
MKAVLSPLRGPCDLRSILPFASLVAILVPMAIIQPNTLSYFGGVMLLNLGVPIVFATLAQLAVITANELDLSIGSFVSLMLFECRSIPLDLPMPASCASRRCSHHDLYASRSHRTEGGRLYDYQNHENCRFNSKSASANPAPASL